MHIYIYTHIILNACMFLPFGDDSPYKYSPMIPVRSQWGHYNSARTAYFWTKLSMVQNGNLDWILFIPRGSRWRNRWPPECGVDGMAHNKSGGTVHSSSIVSPKLSRFGNLGNLLLNRITAVTLPLISMTPYGRCQVIPAHQPHQPHPMLLVLLFFCI